MLKVLSQSISKVTEESALLLVDTAETIRGGVLQAKFAVYQELQDQLEEAGKKISDLEKMVADSKPSKPEKPAGKKK